MYRHVGTGFAGTPAARDGQTAVFTLEMAVTSETDAAMQDEGAKAAQGGPDHWIVATRGTGTILLRAQPSTGGCALGTRDYPQGRGRMSYVPQES